MHCTHPDHEHGSAALLARLELACAERGLRLTALRRRVFELVASDRRPVKAYDLLQRVKEGDAGPVAPPTVYRALDFLMAHGFVHRLESLNAYVPCPHPESDGHGSQFLICEQCMETVELDVREVSARLREQARRQGFEVHRHVVEVYGRCQQCRVG
jgi:Fur family zinc uptake transcriptional regulator